MFLSVLLACSSAVLFLTVDGQGPCVQANCSASAALDGLSPLCNCDANCTEFAGDCCDSQELGNGTIWGIEGTVADGRHLICVANSSLNGMVLDCPAGMMQIESMDVMVNLPLLYGEVLLYDNQRQPLIVCTHPFLRSSLGVDVYIVAFIFFSLSILGNVFILLTYSLFSELRTLPSLLLMNLCVAILIFDVTDIVFYVLVIYMELNSKLAAISSAACLLYSFYCEFVWMNLLSFQIARCLYLAWKVAKPSPLESKWRLLLVYMLIGWGLPLCVIPLTIIPYFVNNFLPFAILLISFLYLLFFASLCMLAAATVFLCLLSNNRCRIKHSKHCDLIRLCVAFFAVTLPSLLYLISMSLTLSSLVVGSSRILSYTILFLDTTHVFIIALAFLLTKKTVQLYKNLFTCTSRNTKATANPVLSPIDKIGPPDVTSGTVLAIPVEVEQHTGDGEDPKGKRPTEEGERRERSPTREGEEREESLSQTAMKFQSH